MRKSNWFWWVPLALFMFVLMTGGCGGGGGGGSQPEQDTVVMREHNVSVINFVEANIVFYEALVEFSSQDLDNLPREELHTVLSDFGAAGEVWLEYFSAWDALFENASLEFLNANLHLETELAIGFSPSNIAEDALRACVSAIASVPPGAYVANRSRRFSDTIRRFTGGALADFDRGLTMYNAGYITSAQINQLERDAHLAGVDAARALASYGSKLMGGYVPTGGVAGSTAATVVYTVIDVARDIWKNYAFLFRRPDPVQQSPSATDWVHGVMFGENFTSFFKGHYNEPFAFAVPDGETNVHMLIIPSEEHAPLMFSFEIDSEQSAAIEIDLSAAPIVGEASFGSCDMFDIEETPIEEAIDLTVTHHPLSPFEGQDVTVTATVFPAMAGVSVTFSVVGTDGYTDAGTRITNANGQITFRIPGAEPGVRDVIVVTLPNGTSRQAVYTFIPFGGAGGAPSVNFTPRVRR